MTAPTPAPVVPHDAPRSEDPVRATTYTKRPPTGYCYARFGYGYHHCHLPRGHAGDCQCHCGETLEPEPF